MRIVKNFKMPNMNANTWLLEMLIHYWNPTEDDFVIDQLRSQNVNVGNFVYFNGVRGPIKIWEIKYPADIEFKEEYLAAVWPESYRGK